MFLIYIISLVIYIIATIMIYHNLYNYDKSNKIKIIVIGYIITFLVTLVLCTISKNGINTNSNNLKIVNSTSILLFSPINAIISIPYMCNLLNKYKKDIITKTQLQKRTIIFAIILLIVLVLESGYIKEFEVNLLKGTM